jgi:hypothetical protein
MLEILVYGHYVLSECAEFIERYIRIKFQESSPPEDWAITS